MIVTAGLGRQVLHHPAGNNNRRVVIMGHQLDHRLDHQILDSKLQDRYSKSVAIHAHEDDGSKNSTPRRNP